MLADRTLRGFIAGILAGTVMGIINIILVSLNISNLLYADWALVYLIGHIDPSFFAKVVGQFGHLLFSGFVGLVFIRVVADRQYFKFKGGLWGLIVWFATNSTSVLFQTEPLNQKDIPTILANGITAIIYGWLLATIISWFEHRKRRTH